MSVSLLANGKVFSGWLSAAVERSLRAISGRFEVAYTDSMGEVVNASSWPLHAGDECTIVLDGETLITGHIDEVEADLSSNARNLSVIGRDLTGNLVDSGTLKSQREFKGQSLAQMAKTLASPFGISVSSLSSAANTPINVVNFQYNETIWETINRLAIYQGVLAYPDQKGGIVFADVSSDVIDSLDERKNILSINAQTDASQKFQTYTAICHSGNTDRKVSTVMAKSVDHSVKIPREKIILISKKSDRNAAMARANWEMAMCVAKSFHAVITLSGWRNSKGDIWQINKMVSVHAPSCGVNGDFLIERTRFILDEDNGMTTQLTVVLRDAYKPQPDRQDSGEVDL